MGSISRMCRAERFIKEFGEDYNQDVVLKPGEQITFVRSFLAQEDGGYETVKHCFEFTTSDGKTILFQDEGDVFDPESDRGDDLIDLVVNHLGIDPEAARRRLIQAALIG